MDIIKDFEPNKDRLGKGSIKNAQRLLREIERFLKNGNMTISPENAKFFSSFREKISFDDIEKRLNAIPLQNSTNITKTQFTDIKPDRFVNMDNLKEILQKLISENTRFVAKTQKGKDKNLAIPNMQDLISNIDRVIMILQGKF